MLSNTVEDYLKTILHLSEETDGAVTVGGIAGDLGVTPGTVTSMMRHLSDGGLVDYLPRKSVTLLPAGREKALQVIRRHRLVETFLVKVMKLDWSEVHEEAEILEHVVSDRLLRRMDEMLGNPSQDPHGDPIPDDRGNMVDRDTRRLSEVGVGRYRIARVGDSDSRFLDWLREHNLLPGCEIELTGRDAVAGVMEIVVRPKDPPVQLGERAAWSVLVEPVP